jgi:hypothetical protein
MDKPFAIVSGLPGSGKSTLAHLLAPALGLPLIDKDAILERLFESKGIGDSAWRRLLSRESDEILREEASASDGAVLVSHWRLPGMQPDSGTPTEWLRKIPGRIVNVRCVCDAATAAKRFTQRRRHPGHGDDDASESEVEASIRAVAQLDPLNIGYLVEVDTSQTPNVDHVTSDVRKALSLGL